MPGIDASAPPAEASTDEGVRRTVADGASAPRAAALLVLNKSDLGEHPGWAGVEAVRISCWQNAGLTALEDAIIARITGGQAAHRDWSVSINARHQACLGKALDDIQAAYRALTDGLSPEFIAEELRAALDAVGEVVGKADSEEILGKIFSTFCIGK